MGRITQEDKLAAIARLRPIDDIFFEMLARNSKVCEEMLRTILEDDELKVENVITQACLRNLYERSVTLDALCILGDGRRCNIEVQRCDNDDHMRRVRYNAASITVHESRPGDDFRDVIDLYVVYISEFDLFGEGLTTYHINKVIKENGKVIDDGLNVIYVNTAVDDGTAIAELMKCFLQKEVDSPQFPRLSAEVGRLKHTEGGLNSMCKVMEELFADEKKEYESIIERMDNQLEQKDAQLEQKDAQLKQMAAELARLRTALEASQTNKL